MKDIQERTPNKNACEIEARGAVCYPTADSIDSCQILKYMMHDALHIDASGTASGRCVVADFTARVRFARCL
ncbi:hypothetical protein TNCV_2165531 [Trichonephila clavipes]|nr:hypothetical protein TNCV_2165531 [Trichonephila clavipes]